MMLSKSAISSLQETSIAKYSVGIRGCKVTGSRNFEIICDSKVKNEKK